MTRQQAVKFIKVLTAIWVVLGLIVAGLTFGKILPLEVQVIYLL